MNWITEKQTAKHGDLDCEIERHRDDLFHWKIMNGATTIASGKEGGEEHARDRVSALAVALTQPVPFPRFEKIRTTDKDVAELIDSISEISMQLVGAFEDLDAGSDQAGEYRRKLENKRSEQIAKLKAAFR